MRWPDEHDDVERVAAKQAVRVRGDGSRIDQTRVRGNERDEAFELRGVVAASLRETVVDRACQRSRRPGIPGARDRRRTDTHRRCTMWRSTI